jgi:hypothetical protein
LTIAFLTHHLSPGTECLGAEYFIFHKYSGLWHLNKSIQSIQLLFQFWAAVFWREREKYIPSFRSDFTYSLCPIPPKKTPPLFLDSNDNAFISVFLVSAPKDSQKLVVDIELSITE